MFLFTLKKKLHICCVFVRDRVYFECMLGLYDVCLSVNLLTLKVCEFVSECVYVEGLCDLYVMS